MSRNSTIYDGSEISQQSSTLPRRHRRHMSSESTFMIWSRDCSPIRRQSPHYSSGSLPRSINSAQSAANVRKSKRSTTEEDARIQQRYRLDEKIGQERGKHFRAIQRSGPSSLESGKTSALSGPSSIDSGKNSTSRTTSCMSSLESNGPDSIRSLRLNGGGAQTTSTNHAREDSFMPSVITSSMSNNSITLQVTTTTGGREGGAKIENHTNDGVSGTQPATNNRSGWNACSGIGGNRTKIYVQNSPARSFIKLENGKLADNANVVIINKSEAIAGNNQREVIQYNAFKNQSMGRQQPLETQFDSLNVEFSDGGDIFKSSVPRPPSLVKSSQAAASPLINNNLNNLSVYEPNCNDGETDSKTHRKLSLQTSPDNPRSNLIYKNLLRQNSDRQTAMEKNSCNTDEGNTCEGAPLNIKGKGSEGSLNHTEADPKQLNTGKSHSQNKLNEDDACNESLFGTRNYLSKLKSLNSIDSFYQKKSTNLVTVGSEPNLVDIKVGGGDKVSKKKEINLTKSELDPAVTGSEDMYDFPSLTDLSFNSLAALKILQELNSEKVKPMPVCP